MKKEETPILEPIPSFSSCLDQARNILFPNIFLKKKEEISGLEENFVNDAGCNTGVIVGMYKPSSQCFKRTIYFLHCFFSSSL
jgi:hypothetical protein